MNAVDIRCTHDHEADAHKPGRERNQEPVADVRNDLAFAPPRPAWITSRPMCQHAEYDAERDRNWNKLEHGLTSNFSDCKCLGEHRRKTCVGVPDHFGIGVPG